MWIAVLALAVLVLSAQTVLLLLLPRLRALHEADADRSERTAGG